MNYSLKESQGGAVENSSDDQKMEVDGIKKTQTNEIQENENLGNQIGTTDTSITNVKHQILPLRMDYRKSTPTKVFHCPQCGK